MKFSVLFSAFALALVSSTAFAQHADLEFGYDDTANPTAFDIEASEFTFEGIPVFESEFEDFAGDFLSDEPGFITEADEGLLVNSGDWISVNVLDASTVSTTGRGYVTFWNPATGQLEDSGRVSVSGVLQSGTDLVINGGVLESGPTLQLLGIGDDDGDIHDHLEIDLLDDATAPVGAYGILMELQSDFENDGVVDIISEPFWFVINRGLDEEVFESQAVASFGVGNDAILLGDANQDDEVNLFDIAPFIAILTGGDTYVPQADCNIDGLINLFDIAPFIGFLTSN